MEYIANSMIVYRIAKADYINDLGGTGAKIYGGRWNEKGTPLLYCAENISLATLEILVHFDGLTIPEHLTLLHLHIPDEEIMVFKKSKFYDIRKRENAEYLFKDAGQEWVESKSSLALSVPSIITPAENNILINPLHSRITTIKKVKTETLDLDPRLFR